MTAPTPSGEAAPPAGAVVLVVCTANICRSPVGERLLSARLRNSGVVVGSAGTRALDGAPVDPPMAELLAAAGVARTPFAARQLRADLLREADLVLTMTREHRAVVAQTVPAVVRRSLLLTEAADLAEAVAQAGWPADLPPGAARIAALSSLGARHREPGVIAAEVPDPYRRPLAEYRQSFALIADAVDRLARAVG